MVGMFDHTIHSRRLSMKRAFITILLASTILTACSSAKNTGFEQAQGNQVAVMDQKITTEYSDKGIILHYTLFGKLESIEVYGVAAAWKSNPEILAEADAKEKLVKFVFGEQVDSDRNVKILAKSLEKARDNAVNNITTGITGTDNSFMSSQLEAELLKEEATQGRTNIADDKDKDNTSRRVAERLDDTITEALTRITAGGRLVGVRKVGDQILDNGRLYVAKYVWSEDDAKAAGGIRKIMKKY